MLTLFFFQNLGLDLHFLICVPVGVVLGIECQWQHFHVMERIVEDVLEFLQIPCVENPVALAVTGIDASHLGCLVFLEGGVPRIGESLHHLRRLRVGHPVFIGIIFPRYFYTVVEFA